MLEAVDVRFGYPTQRRHGGRAAGFVLEGITMRVAPGSVVGVLGPNGSGKSTLLGLLAGSLSPQAGHVRLDGADVSSIPRRQIARRLAVVPQETALAFDYTALEIVLMGRYPHLGPFEVEGPQDLAAAMAALEATGTAALAERPYRSLSGGEKQRVVIASALAQLDGTPDGAPALLVLDEPTASLDLHYQLEVARLITRLHHARGISILLSTHDLRLASAVCTDVVLLSRGRMLGEGRPEAMLAPALIAKVFEVDEADVEPRVAHMEPRVFRPGAGDR